MSHPVDTYTAPKLEVSFSIIPGPSAPLVQPQVTALIAVINNRSTGLISKVNGGGLPFKPAEVLSYTADDLKMSWN
jgi:hypothetical protein